MLALFGILQIKMTPTKKKLMQSWKKIFNIKTGFLGSMLSKAASLKLKMVTEEINDKHLKPWSDLCKKAGIPNTPLTPYLDQELLYNNPFSVDGSRYKVLDLPINTL